MTEFPGGRGHRGRAGECLGAVAGDRGRVYVAVPVRGVRSLAAVSAGGVRRGRGQQRQHVLCTSGCTQAVCGDMVMRTEGDELEECDDGMGNAWAPRRAARTAWQRGSDGWYLHQVHLAWSRILRAAAKAPMRYSRENHVSVARQEYAMQFIDSRSAFGSDFLAGSVDFVL